MARVCSGVTRLALAGGASAVLLLALLAYREPVSAVLAWIERAAPTPGLSGLVLLALSPVAFLALLGTGEWILAGFGRSMQTRGSRPPPQRRRRADRA